MEGNVPKLIVRDIFRNIPRFYRDIEKKAVPEIWSMDLPYRMRVLYPLDQPSYKIFWKYQDGMKALKIGCGENQEQMQEGTNEPRRNSAEKSGERFD